MLSSTVSRLRCPCGGELKAESSPQGERSGAKPGVSEILFGALNCRKCKARLPILMGVALVVPDVRGYLMEHAKGISRHVPDEQIPKEHRAAYLKAKRQALAEEHEAGHETDLEAERVTALYIMNHYLSAQTEWWKDSDGQANPLIERVIREAWDHGPLAKIAADFRAQVGATGVSLVELGCGVGGLAPAVGAASYLGLDTSFASVALARHFVLGAPLEGAVLFPGDLLDGPLSRSLPLRPGRRALDGSADYVVGDVMQPPLKAGLWDAVAALNLIDMLDEPEVLPKLQYELMKPEGGVAISSCPYIWNPDVAGRLREELPDDCRNSAEAVEWLYREAGFEISKSHRHVPWVFFKHLRQIEIYSAHVFFARRNES